MQLNVKEQQIRNEIVDRISKEYGVNFKEATPNMIYNAVASNIRDELVVKRQAYLEKIAKEKKKKLYYMSSEFLVGRSLGNNLLNASMIKEYSNVLKDLGVDIDLIEDQEMDAGLGNGGLGRLAVCFLDSVTTLGYAAYGCGIRYEYGLFKQKIENGYQKEKADDWLKNGNSWEICYPDQDIPVYYGGNVEVSYANGKYYFDCKNQKEVIARPYDMLISGYDTDAVNSYRLWQAVSPNEFDMAVFNSGQYTKAIADIYEATSLSKVLYPADDHQAGKILRLTQQYFMSSATIQWIIKEFEKEHGNNYKKIPEAMTIHINDTHPTLAIPEMLRILMDEKGLDWDDAIRIVNKTFAYTNHTVLAEALEKWPIDIFETLLPRIAMIIQEINNRFHIELEKTYPNDFKRFERMSIIGEHTYNMANLCLATCFKVNGVAGLHTEILKRDIFKDFNEMMPEKFISITNGITFRRWVGYANPKLTELISKTLKTDKWIKDYHLLEKFAEYAEDKKIQNKIAEIRLENKQKLADYIKEHNNIDVDVNSIFDVQVKRIHEYKRQLLNVLHVMYLYNKLVENPDMPFVNRTFIFGGKAAASYTRAKLIIKLINTVAKVINNDERINGKIKVVFIENYGVSLAEKIMVAADVSEQISTAGKEASGTGNMKFMLNGALTIGTLDGANVEMSEQLGMDNIYIFGLRADEVENKYKYPDNQEPSRIVESNWELKRVLQQFVDGTLCPEKPDIFRDLYQTLMYGDYGNADVYMLTRDFNSYVETQERLANDYMNKELWYKKAIINIAKSNWFSSDRSVQEYIDNIWKLKK